MIVSTLSSIPQSRRGNDGVPIGVPESCRGLQTPAPAPFNPSLNNSRTHTRTHTSVGVCCSVRLLPPEAQRFIEASACFYTNQPQPAPPPGSCEAKLSPNFVVGQVGSEKTARKCCLAFRAELRWLSSGWMCGLFVSDGGEGRSPIFTPTSSHIRGSGAAPGSEGSKLGCTSLWLLSARLVFMKES